MQAPLTQHLHTIGKIPLRQCLAHERVLLARQLDVDMVPFAGGRHTECVVVVVADGKVASRAVGVGDGAAEA